MDLRSVAVLFLWEGGEREKYAREVCAACRRGCVGGWLLGCRESAPLLQSPSTGSTRLTGWLFRAVVCVGGAARELDEPSALRWTVGRRG